MTEDFAALERLAGGLIASMDKAGRAKVARELAGLIRKRQSRRIGRQRDAEGVAYAPRRSPRRRRESATHPIRFLYPSGGGFREAAMKTWKRRGPYMVGFDLEAGAVRMFRFDRVKTFLPDDAELKRAPATAARARRGRVRTKAMFAKLKSSRFFKKGSSDAEVWAGFSGRVAQLARLHHEGGSDWTGKPGRSARADYPARGLLGLTAEDRAEVLDVLLAHVTSYV